MILTRSIRRKLAVAFGLLFLALLGLFSAALVGLLDYRALVRDLDVAINEAPRQSELLAAVGQLANPLKYDQARAEIQRRELGIAIDATRREVQSYFSRLDRFHELRRIPLPDALERRIWESRDLMLERLRDMQSEVSSSSDWRNRESSLRFIGRELALLSEIAQSTPPPLAEVRPMLLAARRSYHLHFWLVSIAGVLAMGLLVVTIGLATTWVYKPIKRLHKVASCVAAGNYNTRAEEGSSNDELAQLANALNRMIIRFQTNIEERDREIAQRSQQLIQSARLADTGFLAAGIAHEVNNPLAGVGYAAESLQDRVRELLEVDEETGAIPEPDPRDVQVVNNYLEMIAKETSRIRELTEKMKDFGRRDPGEAEDERYRYDVTAIVAEVISLIGHMKRYSDREITFAPEQPAYAMVVASQIKQVVLNLIANALDAVGPGGQLEIAVCQCPDTVRLTFIDDGAGMDAETLDRLFDPFFTTKFGENGSEKGTGLGLAISHRIVVEHNGTLEAESAGPGQGSRFELRLPKASIATSKAA